MMKRKKPKSIKEYEEVSDIFKTELDQIIL